AVSQSSTSWPEPAEARIVPSGENASEKGLLARPLRVALDFPVARSQSVTSRSVLQEARVAPSGEKATEAPYKEKSTRGSAAASLPGARSVAFNSPVVGSQSFTVLS